MVSVFSILVSVFRDKVAQVEHVGLRKLFLHLVKLVGANRVEVTAVQLLLQNLWHAKIVQV